MKIIAIGRSFVNKGYIKGGKIDSGFIGVGLKKKKSSVSFTGDIEEKMEVVVIVKSVRTEQSCKKNSLFLVLSKKFCHHSLPQLTPILLLNFFLFPISSPSFNIVPFSIYFSLLTLNQDQRTVALRYNTMKMGWGFLNLHGFILGQISYNEVKE